jgi:hypothetical protein
MSEDFGKVEILSERLQRKYHTQIRYVLLECEICGKTWGATPSEFSKIPERVLICRDCAGNIVYSQMNDKE